VALRCVLSALDKTETGAYIAARIWIASGRDVKLFTPEAIDVIYDASRGIPRTISVVCDNALVAGFAMGERPVGRDIVLEVCADFDLTPEPRVEFMRLPIRTADTQPEGDGNHRKLAAAKPPPEKVVVQSQSVGPDLFRAFTDRR
jgi:hypothetical protein